MTVPQYHAIHLCGQAPLSCEHDKAGRLLTTNYLEVQGHEFVFSLGDCACIVDHNTGKPYPPTAQHALRQGQIGLTI